jgi:hypothetical protein
MADSIFDTRANPDVTTTSTTSNTAPDYYTKYLGGLSQVGQDAMANPNKVAELTDYQKTGWNMVPGAATSYQPGLNAATATAKTAAAGAVPQIQDFMNPYTTNVVDEMARLQQQNMQRNLMPQLKAGFVGTGGLGSQRYANVLGQTMSDAQSNLTGQQYAALSAAQKAAIDAALNNTQNQIQAARTQGDLATLEQTSGLAAANAITKAGTEMQTYNQALIDAPLKTATNASALLRGYTVPGTTTETKKGPLSKDFYAGSPLAQTLGVSTLLASQLGENMVKDAAGNWIKSPGNLQKLIDMAGTSVKGGVDAIKEWWRSYNPPSYDTSTDNPDPSSIGQNSGFPSGYGTGTGGTSGTPSWYTPWYNPAPDNSPAENPAGMYELNEETGDWYLP